MKITEAVQAGIIVDVTGYSKTVWPDFTVYFSEEMYHFFMLCSQEFSVERVKTELFEDMDGRIDVDTLEYGVEQLVEVLIGEIPDWFVVARNIGVKIILVANPHDEVCGLEL